MRISPKSLSPAEALSRAKANKKARDDERRETQAEAPEEVAEAGSTSPGSIDAGRAQRLLERADALAGRGDMGAAILAARQSLALAPDNVEAHLLHARLLERNRDFGGARAAYEKSAQLAPDRADARENLARLTTYLEKSQGAARQFHFDADELFSPASESNESNESSESSTLASEIKAPASGAAANAEAAEFARTPATSGEAIVIAPAAATPAAPPVPIALAPSHATALPDESALPAVEARLPPTRAEAKQSATVAPTARETPAQSASMAQTEAPTSESPATEAPPRDRRAPASAAIVAAPASDRRKHNTPVATERRRRPATGVAAMATGAMATGAVATSAMATGAVATSAVATSAVATGAAAGAVTIVAPVAASAARQPVAVPLAPASLSAGAASNPFDLDAPLARPAARAPLTLAIPAASSAPLWQQVITRPSFYARTLPLVGVALLSLGFLSWARGRAVSQVVAPASTELASAAFVPAPDAPATVPGTTLPLPDGSGQSNAAAPGSVAGAPGGDPAGVPISNAPMVFQAPPAQNADANTPSASNATNNAGRDDASNTTARASNHGPNSGSNGNRVRPNRVLPPARPVPNFPGVTLAPAPIPPASGRSTTPSAPRGDNGSNIILPRPSIEMPQSAPPRQRVLPPIDNGLNPAGSPNRGYVRVTEGRVGNGVIPSQPGAVARDNERQANDAARNGQNDQAISQLSQAIRADSDNAGFRYQQRATLFLQRGDYSRASDDFQSAISAYQTQISNGEDVAGAKRGLSSARSGLSLALAGRRG